MLLVEIVQRVRHVAQVSEQLDSRDAPFAFLDALLKAFFQTAVSEFHHDDQMVVNHLDAFQRKQQWMLNQLDSIERLQLAFSSPVLERPENDLDCFRETTRRISSPHFTITTGSNSLAQDIPRDGLP